MRDGNQGWDGQSRPLSLCSSFPVTIIGKAGPASRGCCESWLPIFMFCEALLMHKQLSHEKLIMKCIHEDEKKAGRMLFASAVALPGVYSDIFPVLLLKMSHCWTSTWPSPGSPHAPPPRPAQPFYELASQGSTMACDLIFHVQKVLIKSHCGPCFIWWCSSQLRLAVWCRWAQAVLS